MPCLSAAVQTSSRPAGFCFVRQNVEVRMVFRRQFSQLWIQVARSRILASVTMVLANCPSLGRLTCAPGALNWAK